MKMEGRNPSGTAPLSPPDAACAQKPPDGEKPAEATDRVEPPPEAALALEVQKTSQQEPDIRHDVVERACKALAADEVGHDTDGLAERIIASLLE